MSKIIDFIVGLDEAYKNACNKSNKQLDYISFRYGYEQCIKTLMPEIIENTSEWIGDNIVNLLNSYGVTNGDDTNYINFVDCVRQVMKNQVIWK